MNNSKTRDNNTILEVLKDNLCTGCGTCVSLCPENAINMKMRDPEKNFIPSIDNKSCINCGLCLKACPGQEVDFKKLNIDVFKEEPKDCLIGNYTNCYMGYSKIHKIRCDSSSGGLVTQILIFALENGLIDGALVTKMKNDSTLKPIPFIARSKKEIIDASKSKYCPVPANVALKEILDAPDHEKFAVVGLPCHIHAIRKAEMLNKKLLNKISLHLGLFCHHGVSFEGTDFFINRMKINKKDIVDLSYRGDGWPGKFKVVLNDEKIEKYRFWEFFVYPSFYFFTPKRCFMCSDALNELADISFGDAWLPELVVEKKGISVMISRNKKADNLIQKLEHANMVELKMCGSNDVIKSQMPALYFKKRSLNARKRISKLLNTPFTSDNTYLIESNIFDYLFVILIYINNYLSSFKFIQTLANLMPMIFIRGYRYILYKFINSRNLNK
ncbi:Coenzyme F420 hydrogenase/dehydrogenase, beta subunit C-terminal domain [Methanobacterium spitsbergense]|uniref:Coenzyme F420 hydrogenase/dehydrogenase, beta subunit C-terminal domain n=1 Tax=Methanobacterium spitsbergense TaxID=2874285 RepID=A0A8T5V685_9EURY|nr:Coenzyme F420 hydrogenase/dehydrogenase, beta subunit C-terminal domain [Methanobacterium spitsbergense]MBZ2167135.1 Coenzyme F420 hydrogenase/dehydrogenase, beta subunit C-terminal domain [Methanobacterium spitsbergense]